MYVPGLNWLAIHERNRGLTAYAGISGLFPGYGHTGLNPLLSSLWIMVRSLEANHG